MSDTNPRLPTVRSSPDVEVELVIRVDGHRLCFRAERRRDDWVRRDGGAAQPTAVTSTAVEEAVTEAQAAAVRFVGRAYPTP